jgi:hypothetical protein
MPSSYDMTRLRNPYLVHPSKRKARWRMTRPKNFLGPNVRSYFGSRNPEELRDIQELGIIPLVAAAAAPAIGAIGKSIGSLFKGKKKHHAAPDDKDKDKDKDKDAGGPQLAAVPVDVKADALAALHAYQQGNEADAKKHSDLVKKLAAVVKPTVDKMHADVKHAALKKQVTTEHNKIMKDEQRWADNAAAHVAILQKFDELQSSLTGSNEETKRIFKIFGINA